jgi:hypothetical protein
MSPLGGALIVGLSLGDPLLSTEGEPLGELNTDGDKLGLVLIVGDALMEGFCLDQRLGQRSRKVQKMESH